jgi:hypothetical protein
VFLIIPSLEEILNGDRDVFVSTESAFDTFLTPLAVIKNTQADN